MKTKFETNFEFTKVGGNYIYARVIVASAGDIMPEEERFTGRENSIFTEDARRGIQELISKYAELESSKYSAIDTPSNLDDFIGTRTLLRAVYILVSEKITDEKLIVDIEHFFNIESIPKTKKEREPLVKEIGNIVVRLVKELSANGLIDLKGNSFAGSYPFGEMLRFKLIEKGIDIEEINPYERAILRIMEKNRMELISNGNK